MPINSKGSSLNILMSQLIKSGVPGLSLALADRQGLIATAVAGEADITASLPVKTDHLFGIGSITKTFVAVIILQLINVIPMTRHSNALAVKQYEFKQQFMEHMGVDMEQVSVAIKEIEDAHGSLDVASQLSQSHLERAMAFMTERLKRPPQ